MPRIYIAGPMTGLPELNYPAFHARAAELRAQGHDVLNPAENPAPPCGTWAGYMRLAIAQLVTCDTIDLLPGWRESKGANVEAWLAGLLGLKVQPDAIAVAAPPDPIRQLLARHAELRETNDYAYFELAYTRATGWMAWLTDKPLTGAHVINPDRIVLAQGQGNTPDEACSAAMVETTTCQRCQGNGELVNDWDRYKHPHSGDVGDEAVEECPDCDGTGRVES